MSNTQRKDNNLASNDSKPFPDDHIAEFPFFSFF